MPQRGLPPNQPSEEQTDSSVTITPPASESDDQTPPNQPSEEQPDSSVTITPPASESDDQT